MQIVDFTTEHIESTVQLARQSYEGERALIPALTPVDRMLDLNPYGKNGLAVAAFKCYP